MYRFHFLTVALFLFSPLMAQWTPIPEERWGLVAQYLESQKDFSGEIILGSEGQIRFNHGYGFADRKNGIPFSDQTLSTIGSITKPFTATAILLLMEAGKLNLQDPITRFFDAVPDDKKNITIHQLLTHSAGLPGAIGDDYEAISTLEFQQNLWSKPLLFTPGEGYEYSNVGYTLLGMIIEKITGESYSHYLQDHIFIPAEMSTAGYSNPKADYNHLAHGYLQDGTDWGTSHDKVWNGDEPYWNLKANGGLLMSALDMYHWYLALRNHSVLTPQSLKLQTTPYVDEGGGSFYGYGYALSPDGESVEHNGGNRIFKADFRWFPKADFFLFSTTNDANVRLFRINDEIMKILRTGVIDEPEAWVSVPLETFPNDEQQFAAKAFIDLIQNYTAEKGAAFIPEYCSGGLIERNGLSKIYELLDRLSHDVSKEGIEEIFIDGEKIKVVVRASAENARLNIIMNFKENKIDRIVIEMQG